MSTLQPPSSPPQRGVMVALLLLAFAIGWGLQDLLLDVHESWTAKYGPYAHGYAILALALWLAVQAWRTRAEPLPLRPWWPGALALAAAVGALVLAELLFVGASRQAVLPVILLAAIATAFGLAAAKLFLWPVLFLYFALPQWWLINAPLQDLTTSVSNALVRWTGVPAFVTGHSFELPAGVVEIASGCSGLNYLMAGLALGLFQGLLYLSIWRDRLKLLAVAAVAALVANWLRVFSLILIGYWTDMQHYLVRVDHLYYGWILFLGCMWPVFAYGARLERTAVPSAGAGMTRDVVGHAGPRAPVVFAAAPLPGRLAGLAVAGVLLLVPAGVAGMAATELESGASPPPLPEPGVELEHNPAWSPFTQGARTERRAFQVSGGQMEVFRAWFPAQTSDARLRISLEEVGGPGWRTTGSVEGTVELSGGRVAAVRQLQGVLVGRPAVVRVAYVVSGRPVTGALEAKLVDLSRILRGRREAFVLAVLLPCNGDCEAATGQLDRYLAVALEPLVTEP